MTNPTVDKKLIQALAFHENAVATLRAAIALLGNAPRAKYAHKATNGHTNGHALPAMFEEAIAIDATRRSKRAPKPAKREKKKPKTQAHTSPAIRARRAETAEFLALFDRHKPSPNVPGGERRTGVMVTWGYLAKKGDGYVRTSKPFIVDIRKGAQ